MKVLFFKAPWCSGCHAIEPHLIPGRFEHIDCDKQPEIAEKYGVKTLPLFVAVDDTEKEIARIQTTSIPALNSWYMKLEE